MKNWKKYLVTFILTTMLVTFAGCASTARACKSCSSNLNGGLYRIVNIYTPTGELIASYEGLIDIDDNTNGSLMFDLDGKRYVYYNCLCEIIEK